MLQQLGLSPPCCHHPACSTWSKAVWIHSPQLPVNNSFAWSCHSMHARDACCNRPVARMHACAAAVLTALAEEPRPYRSACASSVLAREPISSEKSCRPSSCREWRKAHKHAASLRRQEEQGTCRGREAHQEVAVGLRNHRRCARRVVQQRQLPKVHRRAEPPDLLCADMHRVIPCCALQCPPQVLTLRCHADPCIPAWRCSSHIAGLHGPTSSQKHITSTGYGH